MYFQTLFSENHSDVIDYNGITYHRFWSIKVENEIKFRLRFVHSNSKFIQSIVLSFPKDFNGNVSVMKKNIHVKKTLFPRLYFWEDTAPPEFDVSVTDFSGEIKICNGSDPIGTKQFCKHLSEGCAMIAQNIGEMRYRFYCHDHEYQGDCDNLIFELEIQKLQ